MNIEFYSSHMETLKDLQELAEKHNCKINFGFRSDFNTEELDKSDLKAVDVPNNIIDILLNGYEHNISVNNIKTTYDDFWFELYDPNNQDKHYNVMSYKQVSVYFEVEKLYTFDEDKNNKLVDWCDENQVDWTETEDGWTFNLTSSPTVINGFGYKKEHKDYRVYRSGMALHYFTELVCKYLKEPMIERTY